MLTINLHKNKTRNNSSLIQFYFAMTNPKKKKSSKDLPGYPEYPESEDIFIKASKEDKINPDDISKTKEPNLKPDQWNEKSFEDDVSGSDLDVPGADLDDTEEDIGSEDEENNYYSLGGDNHNDLEEDRG